MVSSILLYCASFVGFDPTVRSAVDERNSFSLSGSIVSRLGLDGEFVGSPSIYIFGFL